MYQLVADAGDFLVVDKSPGIAVHGPSSEPTLIERVREDFNDPNLSLVHRLDTGTSGLLLIAKSADANRLLAQMFADRSVTKRYLALSQSKPRKKQGWVIGDMVKVRNGNWMLKHSRENPAKTYFVSAAMQSGLRLFLTAPQTGKTHQIRVALRSQHAAILGDDRYGHHPADRLYLHAWKLSFSFKGADFQFECWPSSGACFESLNLKTLAQDLEAKLPEGV